MPSADGDANSVNEDDDDDSGLGTGYIVLIAVGSFVVIAGAVIAFLIIRKKK